MKQDLLYWNQFLKILCSKVWKGVFLLDNDPQSSCCVSFNLVFFSFIQIDSGHAWKILLIFPYSCENCTEKTFSVMFQPLWYVTWYWLRRCYVVLTSVDISMTCRHVTMSSSLVLVHVHPERMHALLEEFMNVKTSMI